MGKNMGVVDRIFRMVVGVVITALFFTHIIQGALGIVLLCVAGIFALTSIISFCPLYTLFGIKTCSTGAEEQ